MVKLRLKHIAQCAKPCYNDIMLLKNSILFREKGCKNEID